MHELLLFASVPFSQHHELLRQLAGLSAMQPRHCLERRLVFKAYRKPGSSSLRTGARQDGNSQDLQRSMMHLNKMLNGNMFYTQVVGPISERDFGSQHQSDSNSSAISPSYDYDSQPWRFEFRDIPEAATRSGVTSRLMASAALPHGDVLTPMVAWGYR